MFQFPGHRDVAIRHAMPVELCQVQGGHQKRVQIDVRNRDFSVQSIWFGETQRDLTRYASCGHRRTKFQLRDMAVGSETPVETSDHILANAKINYSECPIALQSRERSLGLHSKRNQSSDRQPYRLQPLNVFERK